MAEEVHFDHRNEGDEESNLITGQRNVRRAFNHVPINMGVGADPDIYKIGGATKSRRSSFEGRGFRLA